MDPFVLRVIASFVVGGLYVGGVIWISEHFGSRLGGIIGGIPSTTFISLIFIALTSGNLVAKNAAVIVPAMIAAVLLFVYIFTSLASKGHEIALFAGLVGWFVVATLFIRLHLNNISFNSLIGIGGMIAAALAIRGYPKQMKGVAEVLKRTHLIRMLAAGSVIAAAVVVARISGPLWGGVIASFPASTATALYMLNKSQGCEFTKAVTRQFPRSFGATMVFAVLFYLLIVPNGLLLGLVAGMGGALLYAYSLQKLEVNQ